jgi:hypothetical protein
MPFLSSFLAKTKVVKYIPDAFALANLYQKATNDTIPGFTVEQFKQLVDVAYDHVPSKIRETATSAELQTVLVTGQSLFFAVDKAVDLVLTPAKAFWSAIKATAII